MRPHGSASGVLLLRSTCVPVKLKISHKVEDFFILTACHLGSKTAKNKSELSTFSPFQVNLYFEMVHVGCLLFKFLLPNITKRK